MINPVNNVYKPNLLSETHNESSKEKKTEEKNRPPRTDKLDFNAAKLESYDIDSLKSIAEQANENLRRIVEQLVLKQGNNFQHLQIKGFFDPGKASTADIEKARSAISENGEFGVKAVSDRLVEFAKAISGGDKTKCEELRGAIDKGFKAAKDALGGYLPDICQRTYDETMRKLDEWAAEE